MAGQIQAFIRLGMDGIFTDQPDLGVAAVAVAAIPEPETYALMAGGLGVLAWVARNRRRRATGASAS
jgi:glycerophosphoryl diester phosphodiesterase